MPIGKNALKRVENNGYSKVASSAPDMENSEVVEKVEKAVEPVPAPAKSPAKKPAAKKTTAKKTAVKATEEKPTKAAPTKKPAAKKAAPKAKKVGKDLEPAISLGSDLPFYLL